MFGLGLVYSCVLACSMICFQKEVSVLYDYTQNIHKNLEFHIHLSSCVNKSLFLLTTAGLVCVSSCLFGFFVFEATSIIPDKPPASAATCPANVLGACRRRAVSAMAMLDLGNNSSLKV